MRSIVLGVVVLLATGCSEATGPSESDNPASLAPADLPFNAADLADEGTGTDGGGSGINTAGGCKTPTSSVECMMIFLGLVGTAGGATACGAATSVAAAVFCGGMIPSLYSQGRNFINTPDCRHCADPFEVPTIGPTPPWNLPPGGPGE